MRRRGTSQTRAELTLHAVLTGVSFVLFHQLSNLSLPVASLLQNYFFGRVGRVSHGRGPRSCLPLWPAALRLVQSRAAADAPVCLLGAGLGGINLELGGGFAGESKLIG